MRLLALILFCFVLSSASAQPTGGDPNGGSAPGVPITGIEYLIGLGGLYGLKKMLGPKKKTERSD
jgi:hypothetical protein